MSGIGGAVRPSDLSAVDIAAAVAAGAMSAEESVEDHLARVREVDGTVHAWAFLDEERARAAARAVDARRARRAARPMAGVPVGVKDVFNTIDMPTEMGSPIWRGFTPGNDARSVHSVKEADAVVLGKTVTAEFAVHFLPKGLTVNPHDPARSPGTSSSGSAAAVATRQVPVALGTQTAGSIVRPASYCGVWGFKPSFGLIPRTGVLKTTDTLDTIGGLARTAPDLRLLLETMRVRGRDYPFVDAGLRPGGDSAADGRVRIGVLDAGVWVFDGYTDEVRSAFSDLVDEVAAAPGVEVVPADLGPDLDAIHDLHATIYDKTLAYYFAEEFAQHTLISGMMYEIIERGRHITTETYLAAIEEQARIRVRVAERMRGLDVLLTPSTAGPAPLLEAPEPPDTCLIWTFLGLPALGAPVMRTAGGLPVGVQAVASRFDDLRLLDIAERLLAPRTAG